MNTERLPVDIFAEVEKLNFLADQFVVVGSGIMSAKGIRPAYDLDLVVTQELFDECVASGWELKPWTRPGKVGKAWLKRGEIEMMLELGFENSVIDVHGLMKDAEKINGIWFMSLARLIEFKTEYGRPKDFQDIALIEDFLKKSNI